jgi:hypothetical protein
MRRKRFAAFFSLIQDLGRGVRVRVLDVGGTPDFWTAMGAAGEHLDLTILNRTPSESAGGPTRIVSGDARDMRQFRDQEFDVAFSNSVIEHVGSYDDQRSMASEIQRVATRYFVQTPNRYFPIEPHFLLPGFQFYPLSLRAALLSRSNLGWYKKADSYETALAEVTAVRLLTAGELRELFPGGHLYRERFGGLTKSLVVYDGWGQRRLGDPASA